MHGPLERGAVDRCPRDSIVGVDLNKLPIVTTFNVVGVIINLRSVAAELVIVVCGNTGISSHTALFLLVDWRCCKSGQRCRNRGNLLSRFWHGVPSISLL